MSAHLLDRPHVARADALRWANAELGADAAHACMFVRGGDQIVRFHGVVGAGVSAEVQARWVAAEGLAIVLSDADPDHLAPLDELGAPPEDLYRTALWRYTFGDPGYGRALYMNVALGPTLCGNVSFLRSGAGTWEVSESVRGRVASRLREVLRTAWQVEAELAPPEGAVTVRTDGRVVADDAVAEWVAAQDAAAWLRFRAARLEHAAPTVLGRSDRRWAPGAFLRGCAIPGGGTLFCFERVTPMELPTVLSRLTTLQRRVASLAVAGATAGEIASDLGRSPETVKEHLTRIYERLGVASRSELASVCRRMLL